MAAPPILLRTRPLLRLRLIQHHHHFLRNNGPIIHRHLCTATEDSNINPITSPSRGQVLSSTTAPDSPQNMKWSDLDFQKWQAKEAEMLRDIEPTIWLTKQILHSDRYMDGELLTPEDEKAVVEKLLAHHPHSVDKIGCGLDSIMVDRHPQFRNSRCLFVVRIDGGWIDFSYQKCLRAYIREKYPSYAEKFIRKHFKRSST